MGVEDHEGRQDIRRRGVWFGLGIFLLVAGLASPDSLGSSHGGYLPQRLELLGLVALVVGLDMDQGRPWNRGAGACLVLALVLQTLTIWGYALHSQRTAGQIMSAGDLVGSGQRVGTLLVQIRSPYRANPLIHADNWLGVGTGNILWTNYEAQFYYFPVQFRDGIARPDDPRDFELVAVMTDPVPGGPARRKWEQLLADHWQSIDKILTWQGDPALDAVTERWFEQTGERGEIRVFGARSRASRVTRLREFRCADSLGRSRPSVLLLLLLLLQLEEINLVRRRLEVLGPIMAGDRDRDDQLLAVELVDAFGGLALGILGPRRSGRCRASSGAWPCHRA